MSENRHHKVDNSRGNVRVTVDIPLSPGHKDYLRSEGVETVPEARAHFATLFEAVVSDAVQPFAAKYIEDDLAKAEAEVARLLAQRDDI